MEPSHLTLPLKVLPHGEGLPLPAYHSPQAAGLDLMAAIDLDKLLIISPQNHFFVPSGIALAIPFGFEGQIRPRSGLALKLGVTVLNSPGTIDSDYRGEIGVILANFGKKPSLSSEATGSPSLSSPPSSASRSVLPATASAKQSAEQEASDRPHKPCPLRAARRNGPAQAPGLCPPLPRPAAKGPPQNYNR
jgi:dUTP pyrophosphatase